MMSRASARPRRSGATLLEVIVALTILAAAGLAAMGSVRESVDAVERAAVVDREVRAASAFLEAVTLWSRTELDQRLGDRRQGPWWLRIDRASETVYAISLSDSLHREILRTSLFRAPPSHATP